LAPNCCWTRSLDIGVGSCGMGRRIIRRPPWRAKGVIWADAGPR
jgi:hypothetical protein